MLATTILGLEAALVDFAPQLAEAPDNALALAYRGLVQLRRALRLDREGNHVDALAAVQSAVEDHDATLMMHPELAGALNNRAVCLMQAERFHAAAGDGAAAADARQRTEADLARALAVDPDLAEAHFNLGMLSLRVAKLLGKLGRAAAASRRLDGARESLQQAMTHAAPSWPYLRACRAKLAEVEAAPRPGG